jgi:hypothetical protein
VAARADLKKAEAPDFILLLASNKSYSSPIPWEDPWTQFTGITISHTRNLLTHHLRIDILVKMCILLCRDVGCLELNHGARGGAKVLISVTVLQTYKE